MTDMNTDPEHIAYAAWIDQHPLGYPGIEYDAFVAGYRAALQSQPNGGWKEAFKAWNICASIHREWAKGKDAVFTTRQADFVWHAENAFKKALGADALKSQQPKVEFEDPRVQQVYEIICGDNHPPEGEHWDGYVSRLIVDALQSPDRDEDIRQLHAENELLRATVRELLDAADGHFFGDEKDPDGTIQSVVKAARAALAQEQGDQT